MVVASGWVLVAFPLACQALAFGGFNAVFPERRASLREGLPRVCSATRRVSCQAPVMMGRHRKGLGVQRSRWMPREASSDVEVPQGVAESTDKSNRLAKIEALAARRQSGFIMVLEDPADDNNAGAVLRSCDAFGVTEVWFIYNGVKPGTSMRPHVERGECYEPDGRFFPIPPPLARSLRSQTHHARLGHNKWTCSVEGQGVSWSERARR